MGVVLTHKPEYGAFVNRMLATLSKGDHFVSISIQMSLRSRRGAGDSSAAASDSAEGNKYAPKSSLAVQLLVATALTAPIAYFMVAAANSATNEGHGHSHGPGGVHHRDHIPLPKTADAGGQLRGLGSSGAGGGSTKGSFAPGAAGEWSLIDDSLTAEGIRLELVTTDPLKYGFGMTFCDALEEGTAHMRSTGIHSRATVGTKGTKAFSRSMQGVEGAGTGGGSRAVCARTRFYLVDQENEFSDKIIDYVRTLRHVYRAIWRLFVLPLLPHDAHAPSTVPRLPVLPPSLSLLALPTFFPCHNQQVTDHEGTVIELFTGILSASSCKPFENGWPYYCAGGLTPETIAGRRLAVLDYGSNAGFFGQMSARLGYHTIVVEPQPHCVQYIRAATALNGLYGVVEINNGFLSQGGVTPDGKTTLPLPKRTGCMGTWPLPQESRVRQHYDSLPGGNDTVNIPVLDPARLVADSDLVVLAKVDVEGHEVRTAACERQPRERRAAHAEHAKRDVELTRSTQRET